MRGHNEDKLKALRQLTDEVFVISNKPQLSIVQKTRFSAVLEKILFIAILPD